MMSIEHLVQTVELLQLHKLRIHYSQDIQLAQIHKFESIPFRPHRQWSPMFQRRQELVLFPVCSTRQWCQWGRALFLFVAKNPVLLWQTRPCSILVVRLLDSDRDQTGEGGYPRRENNTWVSGPTLLAAMLFCCAHQLNSTQPDILKMLPAVPNGPKRGFWSNFVRFWTLSTNTFSVN